MSTTYKFDLLIALTVFGLFVGMASTANSTFLQVVSIVGMGMSVLLATLAWVNLVRESNG